MSGGVGPNEIQVVALHDWFAVNELITYEALGSALKAAPARAS